jgi:hypothetical protein
MVRQKFDLYRNKQTDKHFLTHFCYYGIMIMNSGQTFGWILKQKENEWYKRLCFRVVWYRAQDIIASKCADTHYYSPTIHHSMIKVNISFCHIYFKLLKLDLADLRFSWWLILSRNIFSCIVHHFFQKTSVQI